MPLLLDWWSFFVFHIGAVGIPLFLADPNMLLQEKLGFSFVSINQAVADVISWGVIFSAILRTVLRNEGEWTCMVSSFFLPST